MKATIRCFFDAAHQLHDSEHLVTKKCANLHGHTYAVEVELIGPNVRHGMILDFKAVKNIVDEFDHRFLNDVFDSRGYQDETTAENIAIAIKKHILTDYPDFVDNIMVSVCEGYKGEQNSNWVTV